MLRIGIDAMGGDFAPEVAVEGAIMALDKVGKDSRIVLFGDEARIRELLKKHKCSADKFDIVATTQTIEMGDHPARAFVAKKDSSMVVGFNHLAEGKVDGFASAGSTGAMMVGCTTIIGTIKGVIRPVISTFMPIVMNRQGLILDVGLNVDAKPEVLAQYGLLGSIFAEAVIGIKNPRVALLNIGEEEGKGNAQAKATYELLKQMKNIN
ncbi:MAG: phosphate--acyl-ACP acyltransferase, partial [Alistipes sp.]|nr:phosphate--acyl-ACP acyltransferase [Alistipes sp.]